MKNKKIVASDGTNIRNLVKDPHFIQLGHLYKSAFSSWSFGKFS